MDSGIHTNGTMNGDAVETSHSTFDPLIFRKYLLALLPPVIGADPADLDTLFDDEFEERVGRFATESGGVIYVVKTKDESDDESSPPTYTYHLTPHLAYHSSNVTTLVLIKRSPTLDPLMPLATQLHFLSLFAGDETPYESLHAVVSCGVKPWFDAFVGSREGGKDDGDSKMGIPMTKKKFAELELSLLHLQQNVEIPETHLVIHPVIQRAVEQLASELNLEGYANPENWVAELDKRIESILFQRLVSIIQVWCVEFDRNDDGEMRDAVAVGVSVGGVGVVGMGVGGVRGLAGQGAKEKEIGLQMQEGSAVELTYVSLLTRFTDNALEKPFLLIESKIQQLKDYVAKWLQFQSLWDLEPEYVFNRLGDSLSHWQQLLIEIKKARSTFDTSETSKSFGSVCVIDYEQVQSRVNAKYDSWQKDILGRFGVKLGNAMKEMHAQILKARNELEHQSIEGLVGTSRRY
ncbi:Dynein heavy chain, cytoplasmic [Leucoagaricus sp. SymC.cos]|nr:Dynein heavy chain, cytoplasmic [Leucoagaricus sp. SymC.cos]